MNKRSLLKFSLLFPVAWLVAYIGGELLADALQSATMTHLFSPIWHDQGRILEEDGFWSRFTIFKWAVHYFEDYPLHVLAGVYFPWRGVLAFLVALGWAVKWALPSATQAD